MEIQQSVVSQAIYGENGRAALPLNIFMKKSSDKQIGGKKDIEHLGVPLVVALVNINVNKPCNHTNENMFEPKEYIGYSGEQSPEEFETIPDEMYDSLLNTVLEEPIEEIPDSEQVPAKKYTRKNRKQ
jgi:hypothetical protein